jgi:hypothetical protein
VPVAIDPGNTPPDFSLPYYVDVHLSYGQSWRSNSYDSFASPFPMNQVAVLAAQYENQIGGFATLPNSAGIDYAGWYISNTISGIINYLPTDQIAIGRCAIIAQQLLRIAGGATTLTPTLEMCFAFPGSTWTSGTGGGLAPGATFTASIAADVMTVTGTPVGTIVPGQMVVGTGVPVPAAGVPQGYIVTTEGSGTGGAGTYNTAMAQFWISQNLNMTHADVTADMARGAIPGNILNVSTIISGTVTVGDAVPSPPALAGSAIVAQTSGTTGGVGLYQVRVGAGVTVGSEPMQTFSQSWRDQSIVITQLLAAMPNRKISGVKFSSVGYTQGTSFANTLPSKLSDLTAMLTDYDALNLSGAGTTGMFYYLGLPAATSESTEFQAGNNGTQVFCRTNAPGQGGPWSGRCFTSGPAYPWPFTGADDIHTGDYGTARWGEIEGYVRELVQYQGVQWTPLWLPLTGNPITISGQTITIPFARPTSPDFAATPMVFQSAPLDGIKVWPNYGFSVMLNSSPLTISAIAINGLNVVLTISQTLVSAQSLEISYAWYGPGGPDPGPNSGVGGNLVMNGPPSVLFPGNTIDAWAWPFDEFVTVP